jgi:hypothetical protein
MVRFYLAKDGSRMMRTFRLLSNSARCEVKWPANLTHVRLRIGLRGNGRFGDNEGFISSKPARGASSDLGNRIILRFAGNAASKGPVNSMNSVELQLSVAAKGCDEVMSEFATISRSISAKTMVAAVSGLKS